MLIHPINDILSSLSGVKGQLTPPRAKWSGEVGKPAISCGKLRKMKEPRVRGVEPSTQHMNMIHRSVDY